MNEQLRSDKYNECVCGCLQYTLQHACAGLIQFALFRVRFTLLYLPIAIGGLD